MLFLKPGMIASRCLGIRGLFRAVHPINPGFHRTTFMKNIALMVILLLLFVPQDSEADKVVKKCPETLRLQGIPRRPANAVSGSDFAKRTSGMSGADRQRAALAEIRRGNVPSFLRALKPLRISDYTEDGKFFTAVIWVTPDYLSIGSDKDFLRIPLTLPSATAIANKLGCILPTRKIVNEIYKQSAIHLKPQPLPPGPQMRSCRYFLKHQKMIERQRAGCPSGELTSGQKKDIVLTNRLLGKPDRIAIYGWHKSDDEPIQPLSTVHGALYADYSHGLRLIWNTVWINGEARSIYEILKDPDLAFLLTYEGVIEKPYFLMHRQFQSPHLVASDSRVLQHRNPR